MTKLELWNLALQHLRGTPVGDVDDMTASGIACRQYYPSSKSTFLSEAPWTFSSSWQPLVEVNTTYPGFEYVYAYPADAIRVFALQGALPQSRDHTKWEVFYEPSSGHKRLASNVPGAVAQISFDVDEPLLGDQGALAVSYLVAANIAVSLIGIDKGVQMSDMLSGVYASYLGQMLAEDAASKFQREESSRHLRARR